MLITIFPLNNHNEHIGIEGKYNIMVDKSFDALHGSQCRLDFVKFLSVRRCGLRGIIMSII